MLLSFLKAVGVLASAAAADVWASGDLWVAVLLTSSLTTMLLATRQYARRRARGGGR